MDLLFQPWHWAFSGFMIVVVMFLLIYAGQKFGVSTSFQTMCSAAGGGRFSEYFNYDWKKQSWLLIFVLGSIIGGYLASHVMAYPESMALSQSTIDDLAALGVAPPELKNHSLSLLPLDLFSMETLTDPKGLLLFVLGGFLIGFGTRYAGGCTSGHAITGLSNLQLPSLVAVIGFFIGGLITTHLLFPYIFSL